MPCPYCLENAFAANCSNCEKDLPPLYLKRHGGPSGNPAILSAVGFSGHGKTVYLAALLHTMGRHLTSVWPRFYRQALDMDSVRTVQANLAMLQRGELPPSTRRNFPLPSLHLLAEIPQYNSRHLIIYDPPGEAFNSDEGIETYAHFVQRARVVLFLVSLVDLDEPKASDLHRLLEIYVLGMAKMKAQTRNQHLIVAYTKADRLQEAFARHPSVLAHLSHANHPLLATPKRYLGALRTVSDELASYTERDLGATDFIRLARREFKSVVFCALSALGSAPEDGRLATAIEPRGVSDPLIWLLDKS